MKTGTVFGCWQRLLPVQFKPHCTNFALDTVAPGWRYLELSINEQGQRHITTRVHRLDTREFSPDLDSDGY